MEIKPIDGKRVLVTGGTGSLGRELVKRLMSGSLGVPDRVTVFSRDEAKQHQMRLDFMHREYATDEIIYENSRSRLNFFIGDVRDPSVLAAAVRDSDIVFHAAALKQVPSCEYFPYEAVQTNVMGAINLVRVIQEVGRGVKKVIGISTDKACKPINVMGMTKALQERILIEANRNCPDTVFLCVRYGNVIASRGSVVPLFIEQARRGLPLSVTIPEMTRFLLTLERAVDTVLTALTDGRRGDTFVPKVPSAKIVDLAAAIIGERDLPIVFTGIRPGEKIHEIMVSEEECHRTVEHGKYYVIKPILPELRENGAISPALDAEYSSRNGNLSILKLRGLLKSADVEIMRFLGAPSNG